MLLTVIVSCRPMSPGAKVPVWVDQMARSGSAVVGDMVKVCVLVPVPPGVVTEIGPLVAFVGTVAVICVLESTVKTAAVPLNLTMEAPSNLAPVTTTFVLPMPLVG